MFLTIQFPLLDLRFLQPEPHRTERPKWPSPDQREIARYFGRIIDKGDKYYGPWDDEKKYCQARGVVNFCGRDPGHFYPLLHQSDCGSRIIFRRFQSDGRFFAKYDVGFIDNFEEVMQLPVAPADSIRELVYQHIQQYLLCPVRVKVGNRLSNYLPLIESGRQLRNAYFWSTYAGKKSFDARELNFQVEDAEPAILLQVNASLIREGLEGKRVNVPELDTAGIKLYSDYIPYIQGKQSYNARAWIIAGEGYRASDTVAKRKFHHYDQTIRFLRINLLRIQQERNILNRLLELISGDQFTTSPEPIKERIFRYLHKKVLNLSQLKRNAQQQDKLVEIAFRLDDLSRGANSLDAQSEGLSYYLKWLQTNDVPEKQQIIDYLQKSRTAIDNFREQVSVFISYNHSNTQVAQQIAERLQEEKIKVIMDADNMSAGTAINDFIINSIKASHATLSIISKESLQSGWVGVETINTLKYKEFFPGKKFIPCNIDEAFMGDDFVIETVKLIDARIEKINNKIAEQDRLQIDSQNFYAEKERLHFLRTYLGKIVSELKGGLCMDITPARFDANFPMIIKAIRA